MHIQVPPLWNSIFVIIFSLVFLYQGYVFMQEENMILGLLLCISILFMIASSIYRIYRVIKARKNRNDEGAQDNNEDDGHHTAASYEKQQLRKLESLHQRKLISKEEYEAKRKEIISHL